MTSPTSDCLERNRSAFGAKLGERRKIGNREATSSSSDSDKHILMIPNSSITTTMKNPLRRDLVVCFFLLLIVTGIPFNLSQNRWYDNTWTIGEWMISYAGGFVRRGLPGSLIYNFSIATWINPVYVIWALSVIAYGALFVLLWKLCFNKIDTSFLLSPFMLLGPVIGQDTFVRKDVLVLAIYGACLLSIDKWHSKKLSNISAFGLINLLSCSAVLSHEKYGFWALPSILILVYYMLTEDKLLNLKAIRKAAIFLSPSLLIFIMCLLARGSLTQAKKIHQAWQILAHIIPSYGAISSAEPIPGAVRALSWNLGDTLALMRIEANNFDHFLWIPAVWLLTIYLGMNLFVGESKDQPLIKLKRSVILLQFLAIAPVFILALDYGRWIFTLITSSAMLSGLLYKLSAQNSLFLPRAVPNFLATRIVPGLPIRGLGRYFLLFAAVPIANWSIEKYWESTPVFFFFKLLSNGLSLVKQ